METYAIVGGSGSLGTILTHKLLSEGKKVRTLSRSEDKIEKLKHSILEQHQANFSAIPGDVCDKDRIKRAIEGCDYLIHAAAMKVIALCEYSPMEAVKINVIGTMNVIDAVLDSSVKKAVFVSSDKAASSVNQYGHTKACAEKLWLHSNRYCGTHDGRFVAVRYGNCWNSRGSVIQAWKKQSQFGKIFVTSPECTRFHWNLSEAGDFVLDVLLNGEAGTLNVPKLPSYKLDDLAAAFAQTSEVDVSPVITGINPGEKLHEEMIAPTESCMVRSELEDRFILTPGAIQQKGGWSLNSGSNTWRVGRSALEKLIRETP